MKKQPDKNLVQNYYLAKKSSNLAAGQIFAMRRIMVLAALVLLGGLGVINASAQSLTASGAQLAIPARI